MAAAAFGSFSIREYASKMRSVDVRQSWPFKAGGEDLKQGKIENLLPPIVSRKYRWWLNELEREKRKVLEEQNPEFPKPDTGNGETEKNIGGLGMEKLRIDDRDGVPGADEDRTGKICPACETLTAGTIDAVDVHIDRERREMRPAAKAKARAPKKRSIMEIFAAAPQIERLDEEDDREVEEEEENGSDLGTLDASLSDVVLKSKRRKEKPKKQKIKKAIEMNDHKKKNKKKKAASDKKKLQKKKKIKKQRSGILAMSNRLGSKKGKILKLNAVPSELDSAQLQQCSKYNKRSVKLIPELDCAQLQQSSKYNKRSVKLIPELVRKQKKKQSKVKMLTKKNQFQIVKASKLLGKTQEESPVFSLRSILKNHDRVTLVRNSSETGNLQGSNLAKHHSLECSGKHVRFSGKDEVIGYTSKQCSFDLALSNDQPVGSDEAQEVNGSNEDAALSILNDKEARYLRQKKQLADLHGPSAPPGTGPNNSCHDMGRTSLGVDLNETLQNSDSLHLVNISCSVSPNNLSHIPEELSYFPKGVAFHEENRVEEYLQRPADTNARMPDPSAYPSPRSAAINSVATITRNSTSQPSLACFANTMGINEQPNLLSATRQSYSDCMLHCPKDVIGGNCSSSIELNRVNRQSVFENRHFGDPGAILDPLPVRSDKWGDDGVVGLPLNSHGELIQLHSSGKVRYNHLFKKQHRTNPSVSTLPLYFNLARNKNEMDHSNIIENLPFATDFSSLRCFPDQNYLRENPGKEPLSSQPNFSTSETVVTGIHVHNKMRETNHSIQKLNSDLNMANIHSFGHREYNQPHNCSGKEATVANSDYVFQPPQPTMRLMGKNVAIGKSGIEGQCLEDGRLWADKEIIAENHPAMTVSGKSISRPCFQREWIPCPASGLSEENFFDSVEDQQNPKPAILQMTASVEPKFAHAHVNCRTHLMSVDGHPMIGGHHGAEFWPFRQMIPSLPLLNRASISQTDCVNMARQMPICVSDPHKSHLQSMMLKSTQFRHNSNVAYNTPSRFQLPFGNQDGGECMQPSRAQCSSLDLHPWLQNGTHQKETLYTSHPCDLFDKHHPCVKPGSSILPHPSPYAVPPFSLPAHSTLPSRLCLQSSSTQASLVHHPSFFPAITGVRPSSKTNSRFINMSKKSNSACLKDPNGAKKAKKRQSQSDESSMPTKKANLELQKDLSAISGLKKRELPIPGYIQYNGETPEFHIHNDKSVDEGVHPVEIEKNGSEIASVANAFKVDGVPRLRPIKLSAGAKHILRPCQNTDHDKGRPTHSTIHFTAVAGSCKVPDFQEKTAKIYRF